MTQLLFNRSLLKNRRDKIAKEFSKVNFLKNEASMRVAEALQGVDREFPVALDIGCHLGELASYLPSSTGIKTFIECDISEQMLQIGDIPLGVACDEELLPFAPSSMNAIFSCLSLHHVNDLVGTLIQSRQILKPDGLFMAVILGVETLKELRECFIEAAAIGNIGMSPHISPFPEIRDVGALLGRAGFALPVIDSEILTLSYESPLHLMKELRAMGETNILEQQHKGMSSSKLFMKMSEIYHQRYSCPDEPERITATIEFITLTAWSPHESQQKPLKRGSGEISFTDVLS